MATPVGAFESDELRAALGGALPEAMQPKIMVALGRKRHAEGMQAS